MDKAVIKSRFDAVKKAEAALDRFDAEHPMVTYESHRDGLRGQRVALFDALQDACVDFANYFCNQCEDDTRALFNLPPD